jgi:TonB family protein
MSKTSEFVSREAAPVPPHLTVRPEDVGPVEVPFLFAQQEKRMGRALGASLLTHGAFLALAIGVMSIAPEPVRHALLVDRLPNEIVWLTEPGPGGGGGGGGNKMPEPPKKAELPGKDKLTVPAVKPKALEISEPKPEVPQPEQTLNIPAQTMAAATTTSPGAIASGQTSETVSQGPGSGGGAGTGTGSGVGPGQGSGLGPGYGGGTGGGPYRPGNGVQLPRVLFEKKPAYTAEAMRAKIQGVVLLECVVLPDGAVGRVEVIRSLDHNFGLDDEAVKAAKQWRFAPGTRFGEPVAVLVTIELTFTLR